MNIFDLTQTQEAAATNLVRLAIGMQGTPEQNYAWARFFTSKKYGVQTGGEGDTQRVDRLRIFEEPTLETLEAYTTPQTRLGINTWDDDHLQKPGYDYVDIKVKQRNMEKPVAIKFISLKMAQVNILTGVMLNFRRNYFKFLDLLALSAFRAGVCWNVYGAKRAAAGDMTNSSDDAFSVAQIKESLRRFYETNVRPFGGNVDSDGQTYSGNFIMAGSITAQNQLGDDAYFKEWRRYDPNMKTINTGYVGEVEQFMFFRVDSVGSTAVGSGSTFSAGEVICFGQDPVLLEPADEGQGLGYVGEFPVCMPMIGTVETRRDNNDNLGQDWISTWFQILGAAAIEKLDSSLPNQPNTDDSDNITDILQAGGFGAAGGVAGTGTSRFIGRMLYAPRS